MTSSSPEITHVEDFSVFKEICPNVHWNPEPRFLTNPLFGAQNLEPYQCLSSYMAFQNNQSLSIVG